MRQAILDQLKKCQWANVKNFNPETGTCLIPKYAKPAYAIGKTYLVKLPGEWVNNPNSIVATNWNAGSYPRFQYMKAYVSKIIGQMIYIDCLAFDFETKKDLNFMWSGWVNAENITLIDVL